MFNANLSGHTEISRHHWTRSQLEALDLLQSPIWIVDVEKQQICWGNSAALKLWNVSDLSSLKDCPFASKIPSPLQVRFRSRKSRLKNKIVDWRFDRQGAAFCLRCRCSDIRTTFSQRAIFVEGLSPIAATSKRKKPRSPTKFRDLVETLPESDRRYQLLANNATALISRHATDGKILSVSPTCKGLLGYEPEELVGLSPQTFIHPRDIATLRESYQAIARDSQTSTMTYQMRHKAGHYLQLETTSQMLREGGRAREILAVSRTIADRRPLSHVPSRQHQVIEAIATDGDLEETLMLLLRAVEEQLPGCAIAIALLDATGQQTVEISSLGKGRKRKGKWRSTPILSARGTVSGRFLMEDSPLYPPTPEKEQLIGLAIHLAAIAIDRKRAETELERAEVKYRSIFENSPVGIFQTSPDGHYLNANTALAHIYGYDSPRELIVALTDVAHQLYVDPQRRAQFIHLLQQNDIIANFESQVYRRDGSTIWIAENTRAVRDNHGHLLYYEGTVQDISARRQAEEQLRYLALHDDLTQLPNRSFFLKYLEAAIASYNPENVALTYGVLFIDLDRFKAINDSLGHWVGDELLKAVAKRLRECLPTQHAISRFGGDEFAVLLQAIAGVNEAIAMATTLLAELEIPFQIGTYELFTRGSIGIVVGSAHYAHPESLLRDADVAMYRAKRYGQQRYEVFDPQMQIQTRQKLQLENDLRRGLERGEFCLYYQPIVSLSTGGLRGFEALVRWNHPQRGLVLPDEFIPLAEENGAIELLGEFVLRMACHQLHQWQENMGTSQQNFQLNVNLSPLQLGQANFVEKFAQICRERPIDCQHLKLEITESCLLETDALRDRCHQLKALGPSLCIDDFGMGYSSLSRLHEFPIDTIKIDRSFVRVLKEDRHSQAIVKTIVTLARGLGMDLVAEGVETLSQIEVLKSLGCEFAQGYFFSPPVAREVATQWVIRSMKDEG